MGVDFHGNGFGNDFLVVTSKVQVIKEEVDKLDFVKIKEVLFFKNDYQKM